MLVLELGKPLFSDFGELWNRLAPSILPSMSYPLKFTELQQALFN